MKNNEITDYTRCLLNDIDVDEKTLHDSVKDVGLLLRAYRAGLAFDDFPVDCLYDDFSLEKDTPAQFHTMVVQMAIIKSKISKSSNFIRYAMDNLRRMVSDFKHFFSK